ncbi:SDR family oxidoreductase [Acidobacteriota bacterium]
MGPVPNYHDSIIMKDMVALVTGSSRGVGRDIALELAKTNKAIAVHYHRQKRVAEGVTEAIRNTGGEGTVFQADLTKEHEAKSLVQNVIAEFGRIDILVNNFGPILVKPWQEVESAEWEAVFRSNLLSALFCIQAVLPNMRDRKWGRIINLGYSRVEQLTSFQTITPYAVAKTGLLILTRSVAVSEASSGITINMVSPGLMEDGILPANTNIPAGRLGSFKDVSGAVQFLVSEKAGYITGTNVVVAGGWKL